MDRATVPQNQITDLRADLLRLDTACCEPRELRLVEGKPVTQAQVKHLASLPSKMQLLAQLGGALQAPMAGFLGVLQSLMSNFAGALEALKTQREGAA